MTWARDSSAGVAAHAVHFGDASIAREEQRERVLRHGRREGLRGIGEPDACRNAVPLPPRRYPPRRTAASERGSLGAVQRVGERPGVARAIDDEHLATAGRRMACASSLQLDDLDALRRQRERELAESFDDANGDAHVERRASRWWKNSIAPRCDDERIPDRARHRRLHPAQTRTVIDRLSAIGACGCAPLLQRDAGGKSVESLSTQLCCTA